MIKVPVQAFSILTENNDNSINLNAPEVDENASPNINRDVEIINLIATTASAPSTSETPTDINSVILNSVCEPLTSGIETENLSDEESDKLLREHPTTPTTESRVVDTFKCSGADWGLSWIHLLSFSLILSFAGPVIYIFYIAENEHKNEE